MLTMLFMTCAVVGGALVVAQLLLSLLAFGAGHGLHLHHGGSVAHRAGPVRAMNRGFHKPARGPTKIVHQPNGSLKGAAAGAANGHRALAWLHGMFNFQGVVSGATVLGLAGLASSAAKLPGYVSLTIGVAAALIMMAMIEALFTLMISMDVEGTLDLQQAVGKLGTVYLSIPGNNTGQGKISVNVQQRLMEFPAVTLQESPLPTGQKIIVVAVQDRSVMQVVSAEKYLPDLEST